MVWAEDENTGIKQLLGSLDSRWEIQEGWECEKPSEMCADEWLMVWCGWEEEGARRRREWRRCGW